MSSVVYLFVSQFARLLTVFHFLLYRTTVSFSTKFCKLQPSSQYFHTGINLLWAGTSRPILWNKNLRSLCVSAGWIWHSASLGRFVPLFIDLVYGICQGLPSDILSIYIIIYFNGQYWLYTRYFILYVKKFGGFFNFCMSHAIYTAVSVWSIYRYNVISFFDTPLNLTFLSLW